MVRSLALLATAGLATIASAAPLALRQQQCYSGFYMIVARGSNEAPGEGKPGQVADMIAAQVPDSASVAVDYPATIISTSSDYPESVTDGISDTISLIQSYVNACGSASRIVLLGYSQGGNVMTDVLAGGVDKPAPIGSDLSQYSKSCCFELACFRAKLVFSQRCCRLWRPNFHCCSVLRPGYIDKGRNLRQRRGWSLLGSAQHLCQHPPVIL